MEKVNNSNDGPTREVKIKVARGISLRSCAAKAVGWTLENSNSTISQEANINKAL